MRALLLCLALAGGAAWAQDGPDLESERSSLLPLSEAVDELRRLRGEQRSLEAQIAELERSGDEEAEEAVDSPEVGELRERLSALGQRARGCALALDRAARRDAEAFAAWIAGERDAYLLTRGAQAIRERPRSGGAELTRALAKRVRQDPHHAALLSALARLGGPEAAKTFLALAKKQPDARLLRLALETREADAFARVLELARSAKKRDARLSKAAVQAVWSLKVRPLDCGDDTARRAHEDTLSLVGAALRSASSQPARLTAALSVLLGKLIGAPVDGSAEEGAADELRAELRDRFLHVLSDAFSSVESAQAQAYTAYGVALAGGDEAGAFLVDQITYEGHDLALRRGLIRALQVCNYRPAVGALIDLYDEPGCAKACQAALRKLSGGQDFKTAASWKSWWRTHPDNAEETP